ncbi:MAG: cupin domain-containing protein [Bacteroidota bacterium]
MRNPKITSIKKSDNTIIGGERQIILSSKDTDGDVYLVEGIMPKGSSVPVHIHQNEDEIFHVLEGEVQVVLGEQTLVGKAGDIIYLPRGIKHGIKTFGDTTAKVLNYVIPGANFENFFNELNESKIKASSEETAEIAEKYGITFL